MKLTTNDANLDAALNTLTTAATFDAARHLSVANALEQKYLDFRESFKLQINDLQDALEGDAENAAEYGETLYTTRIDDCITKLAYLLQTFDADCRAILVNLHNDRAAVLKKVTGTQQNLIQAIMGYATRRGLAQSPKDKPSRHSDPTTITEKYRAVIKTCAPDSKTD